MFLAFECLSIMPSSHFHSRFYSYFCFGAICWYSGFAFSSQIISCFLLSSDLLVYWICVSIPSSIMFVAFERFAGITNLRFDLGYYSDCCFRARCWYSEFLFHLGLYSNVCFRAICWYSEFAFVTLDSIVFLAFERFAGIASLRFHLGYYIVLGLRMLFELVEFAFSHLIL